MITFVSWHQRHAATHCNNVFPCLCMWCIHVYGCACLCVRVCMLWWGCRVVRTDSLVLLLTFCLVWHRAGSSFSLLYMPGYLVWVSWESPVSTSHLAQKQWDYRCVLSCEALRGYWRVEISSLWLLDTCSTHWGISLTTHIPAVVTLPRSTKDITDFNMFRIYYDRKGRIHSTHIFTTNFLI